ncbi:GntR family transcriptional regulator [Paracoccus sp. CPCC 101403]|uniref:GntR family transcriptional regulator n=2 Tax=Paracoccus broussonetiae TaxID=3075834 RepID=A0ABU3EBS7_9RHOB|nr:GntR family transcriptional regulator [Paracoccus sp. CPCC 101403]MDT1060935.1 GntR family transcriptional regulator [Paracoccus sp. CPCC 101403]
MGPPAATLAPLDSHALAGLREHVHRALRHAILSGGFEPGARLNERAIAEQLGVSTTPVKEALRLLEADGLVKTKPRSGVIVNFDYAWAEEMILARAAIESTIARLAAQRISQDEQPVLEQILSDMRSATASEGAEELVRLNELFHGHIRSIARANYLRQLNDRQDVYDSDARRVIHSNPAERERALAEHSEIGRAIIARDAEAAEAAMKAHVLRAGESYLDLVFRKKKD